MASDFIASKNVIPATATTAQSKPDPKAPAVTHPLDPLTPDEVSTIHSPSSNNAKVTLIRLQPSRRLSKPTLLRT